MWSPCLSSVLSTSEVSYRDGGMFAQALNEQLKIRFRQFIWCLRIGQGNERGLVVAHVFVHISGCPRSGAVELAS